MVLPAALLAHCRPGRRGLRHPRRRDPAVTDACRLPRHRGSAGPARHPVVIWCRAMRSAGPGPGTDRDPSRPPARTRRPPSGSTRVLRRSSHLRVPSYSSICAHAASSPILTLRVGRAIPVRARRPGTLGTAVQGHAAGGPRGDGRQRRLTGSVGAGARRRALHDAQAQVRRAMTRRWIWLVPSPISVSFASRR